MSQYENQKIVAKSITLIHFCSLYWFSTDTFISSDRVKLASTYGTQTATNEALLFIETELEILYQHIFVIIISCF
jgi:hypothetical protein